MKVGSQMCEWYNVKVRGILGSRKRDVQEIENVGRTSRWTEHSLEYEAGEKTSAGVVAWLGLERRIADGLQRSHGSEELSREEDKVVQGAEEARRGSFRSLAATLGYMSLGRSVVHYAAKRVCTNMANLTWRIWRRPTTRQMVAWVMQAWEQRR